MQNPIFLDDPRCRWIVHDVETEAELIQTRIERYHREAHETIRSQETAFTTEWEMAATADENFSY